MMNPQGRIILFLFIGISGLGIMQFNSCKNEKKYLESQLTIAKAGERIKELVSKIAAVEKQRAKAFVLRDSVLQVIAERDKSEIAINKKYDTKKNNIRTLDADASILFFSGKISEKSHN